MGDSTMSAKYDSKVDVLRINWGVAEIEESDAISPGLRDCL
ncbi:hypothetical protein [Crocosphaera sp.]|nr:hypothetical protein [Crocosphaera sp.]